jgi:hypothetical protein
MLFRVAADVVPPHDPLGWLFPPKVREAAEDVLPLGSNATAVPLMERLPAMVVDPEKVLLSDPLS